MMFTNCYTTKNGCSANVSDCGCNTSSVNDCGCGSSITNNCGCNTSSVNDCGCNSSITNNCGCGQNLLGCAFGGITNTLYKIINGLDNTSCGCGCRRY